jgi:hypothetical protein
VISGQATTAKELIEDYGDFDIMVSRGWRIVEWNGCHYLSLKPVWAGEPKVPPMLFYLSKVESSLHTIADGLLTNLKGKEH